MPSFGLHYLIAILLLLSIYSNVEAELYIADIARDGVYVMDFAGGEQYPVTININDDVHSPVSMQADYEKDVVYMTYFGSPSHQHTLKAIIAVKFDVKNKKNATIVYAKRLAHNSIPLGLAVDYISGVVYLMDAREQELRAYTRELSHHKLIKGGIVDGKGVAVAPLEGKLFYSTSPDSVERSGKIMRMNSDGTDEKTLVNRDIGWPQYLQTNERYLYWTDTTLGRIERCDFDGMYRTQILENKQLIIGTLALDPSWIYFVDFRGGPVARIPITGGNLVALGDDPGGEVKVRGLLALTPANKNNGTNACSEDNGGCAQLCLPLSNNRRKCVCDEEYNLNEDDTTCDFARFEKILIVSDRGRSGLFVIDVASSNTYRHDVFNLNEPTGLAWDPVQQYIYWADTGYNRIAHTCLLGSTGCTEVVKLWPADIVRFEDIAIDPFEKELYFIDSLRGRIIKSPDTLSRNTTLVSSLTRPRSLALDLTRRLLFWTSTDNLEPSIERVNMDDGSDRTIVINTNLRSPTDIALDPDAAEMFWCDSGTMKIEMALMTGEKRRPLFTGSKRYISIAIDVENVFVTELNGGDIEVIDRVTGLAKGVVGQGNFQHVFDMVYVDTTKSSKAPDRNPPLGGTTNTGGYTTTTRGIPPWIPTRKSTPRGPIYTTSISTRERTTRGKTGGGGDPIDKEIGGNDLNPKETTPHNPFDTTGAAPSGPVPYYVLPLVIAAFTLQRLR